MAGVTTSTVLNTDSALKAREIDFVTQFEKNWDALRTILGIFKPIRKEPGTSLVTYAQMKDEALQGGASVGEGEAIPFTQFKVVESKKEDIVVEKYAKSLTLESVAKWGATVAIEKTDDAFMVELQNKVLKDFYTFLNGNIKRYAEEMAESTCDRKRCCTQQIRRHEQKCNRSRRICKCNGFLRLVR